MPAFLPRHLALPAILALCPVACRAEPRDPPAVVAPPASTSTPAASASSGSTVPYGAVKAQPGDEQNDNEGCKRRRNSGVLATCESVTSNFGAWTPTVPEMTEAMKSAGGVCYCAENLYVPAEACAKRVGASTLKVGVGKQDDPTDCTITISAVSWKTRRWIVVSAFNRDQGTFYGVVSIQERTAKGFETYFEGFNNLPSDGEIQQGAQGVSAAMKRDWPALPADVKNALGAT
jgi:hypothetical protein